MTQRTLKQNKAMYKYFELLASALNDAGYDVRNTLRHDIAVPWNKALVKEYLWHPIQEAMKQQGSTTEMDTKDVPEVYEVLNENLGTKLGVHVPWPSDEPPMINEHDLNLNRR